MSMRKPNEGRIWEISTDLDFEDEISVRAEDMVTLNFYHHISEFGYENY